MPNPAISPTSITESNTFTISDSKGVIVNLSLDLSSPKTFTTQYPTEAAFVQITLIRGSISLNLLPNPASQPFSNRTVTISINPTSFNTELSCTISSSEAVVEEWEVRIANNSAVSYQFTQLQNLLDGTITRIMCDPIAEFTIGGEASANLLRIASNSFNDFGESFWERFKFRLNYAFQYVLGLLATFSPLSRNSSLEARRAKVQEKGSVVLTASNGLTPATVVKTATASEPVVHYRWTIQGSITIPDFPVCGTNQSVAFFAPAVDSNQKFEITLQVWFDGACPSTVGFLNSTSIKRELVVEAITQLYSRGPRDEIPDDPAIGLRSYLFDNNNGIIAIYGGKDSSSQWQIYQQRLDLHNIVAGFSGASQVSSERISRFPHAAVLPNGELIVVYGAYRDSSEGIFLKHASLEKLSTVEEQKVASTNNLGRYIPPFIVVSKELVVVFYPDGGSDDSLFWQYRRYQHNTTPPTWLDATPQQISAQETGDGLFHAARDLDGNIWVAFCNVQNNIHTLCLNPFTGIVTHTATHDAKKGNNRNPFVLVLSRGNVWVFWDSDELNSDKLIHYSRFTGSAWESVQAVPDTLIDDDESRVSRQPTAVEDSDGGLWLFWIHAAIGPFIDTFYYDQIFFKRRNSDGSWSKVLSAGANSAPFALISLNNTIWIFCIRIADSTSFTVTNFYQAIAPDLNIPVQIFSHYERIIPAS
ncbi:hypothetical protein ACKFKG_30175 [Phormidesmis sp. 146-35]